MKTYQPSSKEIKREKHVIDAKGQVLGRLATKIANLLTGKGKVTYSAHMDSGDFVQVINAKEIIVTGNKAEQKTYIRHSGYPKGFKEIKYEKMHKEMPSRVIKLAVNGMLPDNRLKSDRIARLTFK